MIMYVVKTPENNYIWETVMSDKQGAKEEYERQLDEKWEHAETYGYSVVKITIEEEPVT